jgi:hypothetical protein
MAIKFRGSLQITVRQEKATPRNGALRRHEYRASLLAAPAPGPAEANDEQDIWDRVAHNDFAVTQQKRGGHGYPVIGAKCYAWHFLRSRWTRGQWLPRRAAQGAHREGWRWHRALRIQAWLGADVDSRRNLGKVKLNHGTVVSKYRSSQERAIRAAAERSELGPIHLHCSNGSRSKPSIVTTKSS